MKREARVPREIQEKQQQTLSLPPPVSLGVADAMSGAPLGHTSCASLTATATAKSQRLQCAWNLQTLGAGRQSQKKTRADQAEE